MSPSPAQRVPAVIEGDTATIHAPPASPHFVDRAPAAVVEQEKARLADFGAML